MEIPPKGSIKDVSLVKLLVFLNRNRKTGTLSLKTPLFTKNIYINAGDAIFASSTYEDDRLGEMLLKANKITVEQYDKSVELLKSSKKRQGAILVELGYLTPKDLFWGVKYQVKEIIHSMFLTDDAEYEFLEGEIPNQEVITLKMSMANLIYDGVKKIENWTRIRNEMPDTDSVLRLSADPLSLFQGIELSSQDKKILSLIDGKKTIKEVIENSWMGSFEALKILFVLWSTGIIEQATAIREEPAVAASAQAEQETMSLEEILSPLSGEEEALTRRIDAIYPKLGSLSMYELLDAPANADSETIRRNYYRLAKEFHPDRYFGVTDDSVKTKLTEIFDAVTKAYNILKDEKTRQEYVRSLGTGRKKEAEPATELKAEDQFKKGVDEFKRGNYWGAVDHFKWATKLTPKSAQYWSYLSLAFSKMPGKLKDAEEALLTAVKIEPFNADNYANLGLIYMKAGIRKRAHSNFEKALRIDPSNEKAKKGLAQTKEEA
jgi:tetratricopeptide (TPR) repeat protein